MSTRALILSTFESTRKEFAGVCTKGEVMQEVATTLDLPVAAIEAVIADEARWRRAAKQAGTRKSR